MATYSPAAPWAGPYPVEVTDTDTGTVWEAVGASQLKKPTVVIANPEDCCLYTTEVPDLIDPDDPPEAPTFAPTEQSDGDTFYVQYANGSAMFTSVGGAWVRDWFTCGVAHSDTEYAAGNEGGCGPEEGLPVGKNAEGKLVQQPPSMCNTQNAAQGALTIVGAALTPLQGGVVFESLCATIENPSCYRMIGRAFFRTNVLMQLPANIRSQWFMSTSGLASATFTGGGGSWAGATVVQNTACDVNNCPMPSRTPVMELGAFALNPGGSAEYCQGMSFNATQYTESTQGAISVGANTLAIWGATCQEAAPVSSTSAVVLP